MAPKIKKKKSQPLNHSEKLSKSAKDSRDIFLLLFLLLAIILAWNLWTRHQVKALEEEIAHHESIRKNLDELVTPALARRLYELEQSQEDRIDLRKHVQKILKNLNVPRDEKERIEQPKQESLENTRHEYVVVRKVKNVELNRLVYLLTTIRGPKDNIWCTKIDEITPVLDSQGFAVVTTKGDPVYDIKALKISRFTEIIQ